MDELEVLRARRTRLQILELNELYKNYLCRLFDNHFVITYTITHVLTCIVHIIILLIIVEDIKVDIYEIVLCVITAIITFLPLYLTLRQDTMKHKLCIFVATFMPLVLLAGVDVYFGFVDSREFPRPIFQSYILIASYIFMPLFELWQCLCLGIFITFFYTTCLFFVYELNTFSYFKILREFIFLLSLNIFGLFFHLLKEILVGEAFMDKWDLINHIVLVKHQSNREKNLLLTILPRNTARDLVHDIMNKIKLARESSESDSKLENFNLKPDKLYIYYYNNVTILFADVVNFTYMTTTLDVKPLVTILHELYVKFDEAADENRCLRIKFLGDCYYCVAGIPEKNDDHALCCVKQGLKMIKIMQEVRNRLQINVDMRIGVHSGNVYAGIIGTTKWQYDIWSRDVEIANKLESTGLPRIHVSKYTLSMLNNIYKYEEGPEQAKKNEFLNINNITETYLIIQDQSEVDVVKKASSSSAEFPVYRSPSFAESILDQYKKVHIEAMEEMSLQFKKSDFPKSLKSTCARMRYQLRKFGRIMLGEQATFYGTMHETLLFWNQPDIITRYSCLTTIITYFGIAILLSIAEEPDFDIEIFLVFIVLLLWTIIVWYPFIWGTLSENEIEPTRNKISELLYNFSYKTLILLRWKFLMNITILGPILITIIFKLTTCDQFKEDLLKQEFKYRNACFDSWKITDSLILLGVISFYFLNVPFVFRLIFNLIIIIMYIYFVFWKYTYIYDMGYVNRIGAEAKYGHVHILLINFFLITLMQWQTENYLKLNYVWKKQLKIKTVSYEISKKTARLLIENLLPAHVADLYMDQSINDDLYTESYENVAIMFATIRNYDIEIVGLRVLNKIICDFDEMLSTYSGPLKIEKIKVVGWTYMAACGLDPQFAIDSSLNARNWHSVRGSSNWFKVRNAVRSETDKLTDTFSNVYVMAVFALELMKTLHQFNTYFSEDSQSATDAGVLRIGISHGDVMAGVVGTSKPLYDVWGNTVNMASRMDTTGIDGQIQVTKETALVLESFNIKCEYRGLTYVKGKDYIPTYIVAVDPNKHFVPRLSFNSFRSGGSISEKKEGDK